MTDSDFLICPKIVSGNSFRKVGINWITVVVAKTFNPNPADND
jgi:hypothetical protein